MAFLTQDEFLNARLYEIDDRIYNRIKGRFASVLGDEGARRFLERNLDKTVAAISANSLVNIMDCLMIL